MLCTCMSLKNSSSAIAANTPCMYIRHLKGRTAGVQESYPGNGCTQHGAPERQGMPVGTRPLNITSS